MANKYLNDTGLQYFFNKLKTIFLTSVDYDSTNKKITKTLNGTKSDVVTLSTLKTAMALNNVANGAEVNQNAFSNVKVGSTTVAADSKTDTLELVAGNNVTLTPDATNDKVTIAAANAVESVAGKTGVVVLSKSDVGLGNVNNTADQYKSVLSAATLTTPRTIDGVSFSGGSNIVHFGACGTSGSTAIKIVDCAGFTLTLGAFIIVYFTMPNTASESNLKLNVNDTGPIPIRYKNATLPQGTLYWDFNTSQYKERAYMFVYDGTYYQLVGDLDTNTTYSSMSQSEATTGTATTGRLITAKVLSTTIANAIAGVTQISYQVVTELPATGTTGVIYLIAHSHGTGDGYDEYIWLGSSYEKIGNTDVDLSGYLKTTDMVAITTSEIDTLFA